MIEKVKVTQEQAEALSRLREWHKSEMEKFKEFPDLFQEWLKPLVDLSTDEIDRACYEGYEVAKPSFVIGGWKRYRKTDCMKSIGKVTAVDSDEEWVRFDGSNKNIPFSDVAGDPAAEEIDEEKERRFWESLGRGVKEFKSGDVGVARNGMLIRHASQLAKLIDENDLVGFYPIESFVKFGGDE